MNRLRSLFGRSRRWVADGLTVVAVGAVPAPGVMGLGSWLPEIGRAGEAVGVVQVFATALVIVVGGLFAYRKLQLFRDVELHLTVAQAVSSRAVGDAYAHIAVTATLHNSSKVRM